MHFDINSNTYFHQKKKKLSINPNPNQNSIKTIKGKEKTFWLEIKKIKHNTKTHIKKKIKKKEKNHQP